jgi:hypothetical protein
MSKTKNNHYIPQFYTSQWKFNDKQVCCLDKERSKIITTSPRNIFGDRLWSDEVEKWFTQFENNYWIPVVNKIIKEKTMALSERDLESFLSFAFTLKVRNKRYVDESHKAVKSNFNELYNEWLRDGTANKEEIFSVKQFEESTLDFCFLSSHTPASIFSEGSEHNQFKKLSFDVKVIQEKDMHYGQFLTSDCPVLILNKENEKVCLLMLIALTPNLLVFGTKGADRFVALNNKPIDIIVKIFNQTIYDNSKYIISNKRSLLEQFI